MVNSVWTISAAIVLEAGAAVEGQAPSFRGDQEGKGTYANLSYLSFRCGASRRPMRVGGARQRAICGALSAARPISRGARLSRRSRSLPGRPSARLSRRSRSLPGRPAARSRRGRALSLHIRRPALLLVWLGLERSGLVLVRLRLASRLRLGRSFGLEWLAAWRIWRARRIWRTSRPFRRRASPLIVKVATRSRKDR
jgi:hypothetical protein